MTRRVYFDSNNFKASSPLRLVYALEDRGVFSRIVFPVGRSQYRPRPTDIIINWGNPPQRQWEGTVETLNKRENVALAIDKLDALTKFKEANVRCPKFTQDYEEARGWSESHAVVGRSLLRSFQGRGIAFTDRGVAPATADAQGRRCVLWTRYVPKREEWRVHVFKGQVIGVAQKKRRRDANVDSHIRSWDNGWVYAIHDLDPPEDLSVVGIAAVQALGLDLGAVDVVWNERKNRCTVLEVNTAPAIENSTVIKYADSIAAYARQVS